MLQTLFKYLFFFLGKKNIIFLIAFLTRVFHIYRLLREHGRKKIYILFFSASSTSPLSNTFRMNV